MLNDTINMLKKYNKVYSQNAAIAKNNIIIVSAGFNQLQMIYLKIFFVDDYIKRY